MIKYVAAVKNTLILLAVILFNSVSLAGHSAAVSPMSHEMSGMNHNSKDTSSCATLCRTAVIKGKENIVNDDENDNKDEPELSFYASDQTWQFDGKSETYQLYAADTNFPPKIPIYLLYDVWRT